jgi:transposase-like protein
MNGNTVEVDETFIGKEENIPMRRGYAHKCKVLSLLDRELGKTRSMVVDNVTASELVPILKENIAREAQIMTDDAGQYRYLYQDFLKHGTVHHSKKEYVSLENPDIHTNTVEGYFSIFKRGMKGIYQHCKKQHLHRYLAEFDFRYNKRSAKDVNDIGRVNKVFEGVVGRRLTYETTH